VGVGLISYSLYLFHWPIFVFYKYWKAADLMPLEKGALIALSCVLATLSYFVVEMPFRRGGFTTNKKFGWSVAGLAMTVALASLGTWVNDGWPGRFYGPRSIATFDLQQLQDERHELTSLIERRSFSGDGTRILIVGDSHAADLAVGLRLSISNERASIAQLGLNDNCGALLIDREERISEEDQTRCKRHFKRFEASELPRTADLIIVTNLWIPELIDSLPAYMAFVRGAAKPNTPDIVLTTRAPNFVGMPRSALKMYVSQAPIDEINAAAFRTSKLSERSATNDVIREYARNNGLHLIERRELICSAQRCDYFIDETALGFWDSNHWTVDGARIFGQRFLDQLEPVLPPQ
jgi:hypothetical protein